MKSGRGQQALSECATELVPVFSVRPIPLTFGVM